MRNLIRVLLVLLALLILFTTVVMSESPSGRTFDVSGTLIDVLAVLVLGVVLGNWLRERKRTASM